MSTRSRRKSLNASDWSRLIYALLGFLLGGSNTINLEPFAAAIQPLLGV